MGAKSSQGEYTESKDYELMEAGVYAARCIACIELGTHKNTHPQAPPNAVKKDLMIIWEFSGELMEDGRPFTINKRYTNSLGEKANLRKDLKSWRGRDFTPEELKCFELKKILDAPCMLNVTKTQGKKDPSKQYNNVLSIMPMPKGMTLEPRVNDLVDFGIDDRTDAGLMAKIWPWVQTIIMESYEAQGLPIPGEEDTKTENTSTSDEIPF